MMALSQMRTVSPPRESRAESLERENQTLRDRVEELEALLGVTPFVPASWRRVGGMPLHWRLLVFLLKRGTATREEMVVALYGHRYVDRRPESKTIDVHVCKLRRVLRHEGIEITTNWGQGFSLSPQMRVKAQALVERLREAG